MAKIITNRLVDWTTRFTLDAVDRSVLWVDRLNRRLMGSRDRLASKLFRSIEN